MQNGQPLYNTGIFVAFVIASQISFCWADRLDQLEKSVDELQKSNQQLEERLAMSENKTKKQQSTIRKLKEAETPFNIHGFMSAYATKGKKNVDVQGLGIDEHWSYRPDTMAAVQMDYAVADKTKAIVQFIAHGYNDFDLNMSWGYVAYQMNDYWLFRLGRLQSNLYRYSETLDVGFSYPWVRPPLSIYVVGISNVEGISSLFRYWLNDWLLEGDFVLGTADWPNRFRAIKSRNSISSSISIERDYLSARLNYVHAPTTIVEGIPEPFNTEYFVLSTQYDDNQWYVNLESSKILGDSYQKDLIGTAITIGYKLGRYTTFVSYEHVYSTKTSDDRLRSLVPEGVISQEQQLRNFQLGLRYDIDSRIAAKFQVDYFHDFDGTGGGIFDTTNEASILDAAILTELGDSNMLYTVGIDLIF